MSELPRQSAADLTAAQRDGLVVLAAAHPESVHGCKRRSEFSATELWRTYPWRWMAWLAGWFV